MTDGNEVLRTVLFLHDLRDGKHGLIPRGAMDAINRFLDAYVDDLPEAKDLPMALVSAVAGWDASRRARHAMEDREAAAIARAVAAENSLARLREKRIERFLPPDTA